MNPRYPVYVISKGRWEKRPTVRALEKIGVPHRVVIEPQEREQYASVMNPDKLLLLPFSNLGQGSIPARNWVWEHSIGEGHARHWILDDNISKFCRYNRNLLITVSTGAIFAAAEDFTDRYENVPMSGMNYYMFVPRKEGDKPPFYVNTRVYSCILLSNKMPHRWRGRYNEDTDLSIRFLKDGYCTILFNAFIADKMTTMKMKGGNTDDLYKQDSAFDGRLEMARSLQRQHPDIVKVSRKWGRWQHHVDYRRFRRNKLVLRGDAKIGADTNDYGMRLKRTEHVTKTRRTVVHSSYEEMGE
jgi:hypothetical protein